MQKSSYQDVMSEAIHLNLERMFATEFSACLGMSKHPPLRAVGKLAVEEALAKI
jgi:hypothetical protein